MRTFSFGSLDAYAIADALRQLDVAGVALSEPTANFRCKSQSAKRNRPPRMFLKINKSGLYLVVPDENDVPVTFGVPTARSKSWITNGEWNGE